MAATGLAGCGGSGPAPTQSHTTTGSPPAPAPVSAPHRRGCFQAPGRCGFPDPQAGNVGVADCSSLQRFAPRDLPTGAATVNGHTLVITKPGLTISDRNIEGWQIYDEAAPRLTLDHDCVSLAGGGNDSTIVVWSRAPGLTVRDSTLVAPGCPTASGSVCTGDAVDQTLIGGGANTTVRNDLLAGASEPINGLGAGSVVADSYVLANGTFSGAHSEAIYESAVPGITITHNTLLDPLDQSAVVYGDVPTTAAGARQPCANRMTVSDNLMAGGGWIIVACAQASGPGTSRLRFTGNRIARCAGSANAEATLGGRYCAGSAPSPDTGLAAGARHGYWPRGGFFSVTGYTYCPPTRRVTWRGNVWDDNGRPVGCRA